jgi:myosin-7
MLRQRSHLQGLCLHLLPARLSSPQLVAAYLHAHLKWCALNPDTEEGKYAQFCQKSISRIIENKNRKYPPSRQEVLSVVKRQQIHARFHFMDNEFRALPFDSASSTSEVRPALHHQSFVMGFRSFL